MQTSYKKEEQRGQILPLLTVAESHALIQRGVATGGMQAKLNAATEALQKGVREVVIAPGEEPGIIGRFLLGEAPGTRLIGEGAADD